MAPRLAQKAALAIGTMKFGHTLLAAQWGPWEDVYIPYKALKKILKAGTQGSSTFADTEGAFMMRLLKSVRSVDDFFQNQARGPEGAGEGAMAWLPVAPPPERAWPRDCGSAVLTDDAPCPAGRRCGPGFLLPSPRHHRPRRAERRAAPRRHAAGAAPDGADGVAAANGLRAGRREARHALACLG